MCVPPKVDSRLLTMAKQLSSRSFQRLVTALKQSNKTITVIEQTCGGIINSSILAQPGASAVYYGGSVSYNTRKAKPLLLNDEELHTRLNQPRQAGHGETEADAYRNSKLDWTAQTSIAFCKAMGTDYAIAEGGAAGPTFRPKGLDTGFSVISIAGKNENGEVEVLKQEMVHSTNADRQGNMLLFANKAADLATQAITGDSSGVEKVEVSQMVPQLDRVTHLRSNEEALTSLEPSARYILLKGNEILSTAMTGPTFLTHQDIQALDTPMQQTFLGKIHSDGTPLFGVDLLDKDNVDVSGLEDSESSFVNTRTTAPLFSSLDNEIALHATAYANWQRRSAFCSLCGAPTVLIQGGTCRKCTSCNTMTWPRQDPSMIAVIGSQCGEKVLLAQSSRHPPKFNTVLAGFVEAGETFEAAVARETFEETGILIDEGSVDYVGSQPWPFPQSCMIGFSAIADADQPLNVDTNELVSAGWYSREDVQAACEVEGPTMQLPVAEAALTNDPSLNLLVPPKGVIARKLIERWLEN